MPNPEGGKVPPPPPKESGHYQVTEEGDEQPTPLSKAELQEYAEDMIDTLNQAAVALKVTWNLAAVRRSPAPPVETWTAKSIRLEGKSLLVTYEGQREERALFHHPMNAPKFSKSRLK